MSSSDLCVRAHAMTALHRPLLYAYVRLVPPTRVEAVISFCFSAFSFMVINNYAIYFVLYIIFIRWNTEMGKRFQTNFKMVPITTILFIYFFVPSNIVMK